MSDSLISFTFKGWDRAPRALRAAMAQAPAIRNAAIYNGVSNAIAEIARQQLASVTPVDTGKLQASTDAMILMEDGRATLMLTQPATNDQGQQYARYVVEGHYVHAGPLALPTPGKDDTRPSASSQQVNETATFVPPNPYPQEAAQAMIPLINRVTHEIAQEIAQRTVHVMGSVR